MNTEPTWPAVNAFTWCEEVKAEVDKILAAGKAANKDEALDDAVRIVRARRRNQHNAAQARRTEDTNAHR